MRNNVQKTGKIMLKNLHRFPKKQEIVHLFIKCNPIYIGMYKYNNTQWEKLTNQPINN